MALLRTEHGGSLGPATTMFEPPTTWEPPRGELPVPSGMLVAIDIEGRDGGLARDAGPGWVYNDGHICGVSAAWDGWSGYVPMRHPGTECRSPEEVLGWAAELMRRNRPVFHHAAYDLPWLLHEGVAWPEDHEDTYAACVMLDENWESYDLDSCCARAGVPGKDEAALRNAAEAFGVSPKSGLWRLPARHVGPYAEQDAVSTLGLWQWVVAQPDWAAIADAYRTEIRLMRAIRDMRARGIRVDVDQAARTQQRLAQMGQESRAEIARMVGRRVSAADLRSPESLGDIIQRAGVTCPLTPKTQKPSVRKEWLEKLEHPIGRLIRTARQTVDLSEKFIGTYILGSEHRGRIHAEVHQLRDEDGGTRTFRLSYSQPPLQQMPSRDRVLAPLIRSIMLPEPGEWWCAPDFSQQEPRLAVHFSAMCRLHGSDEAVHYYATDPLADFHTMVARLAGIPRDQAKIINLGLMYGMGIDKLAASLGMSVDDATALMSVYHVRVPWVKGLTETCSRLASDRGWIRLIDGARCHFDLWVPIRDREERPLRLAEARELEEARAAHWGRSPRRLVRAGTHKAMNRLVQGSAARQTKLAMLECHRQGIPILVQMHDELGLSTPTDERGQQVAEIMRSVVRLRVPVKVDVEYGRSWGSAKHSWERRDAS
jgi:DNA polymerase I-like protein with 3'-5' exonuclease and polymerase domains